jgi:hypothetical protein
MPLSNNFTAWFRLFLGRLIEKIVGEYAFVVACDLTMILKKNTTIELYPMED